MRTAFVMAIKDLRLITRDWLGLFFIIGFPILMGVFFGSMYGGVDGDDQSRELEIAVVDQDDSETSRRFIEKLDYTPNVAVKKLKRQAATDQVRRGDLVGMIVVPKAFGTTAGVPWMEGPALQLGVDPSRKAEGAMLHGLIMQAAGSLMMDRFQNPDRLRQLIQDAREQIAESADVPTAMRPMLQQMLGSLDVFFGFWQKVKSIEQAAADASDSSAGKPASRASAAFQIVKVETIDVTHQPAKGSIEEQITKLRSAWDISFPQAMMWGVLGCAAAFAITIVRERKQGTLLRLQAAPVSRSQVIFGKALACFSAVLGVIVIMVALGACLGMRPGSPGLLAVASLCVAFCFVGIMILMSVSGRSEEAVSGAAWGANMLMAMFGGGMIPLVFMPEFMATLSQFSPVKWSILSLEGAIWRGFSPTEMLLPCGILLLTGGACLILGAVRLSRMTD